MCYYKVTEGNVGWSTLRGTTKVYMNISCFVYFVGHHEATFKALRANQILYILFLVYQIVKTSFIDIRVGNSNLAKSPGEKSNHTMHVPRRKPTKKLDILAKLPRLTQGLF